MNTQITNTYPPPSEATVAAFETQLNIQLPPDYRLFLLEHNGGKPKSQTFFISAEQGEDILRYFLGIPQNFLPIGVDTFGNLICLSIAGDDYDKVYFWDHDWEVTEGTPDYSNVYLLADSFDSFLNKLYDSP
ncbi:MAG: SMI1/KNR4 family protein [Anaerolineae bacterium]|nr:SMI1/KNR4 family protein [Anaerolineae bacterium]